MTDQGREIDGVVVHYPVNYGYNAGMWLLFDNLTKKEAGVEVRGAFAPNSRTSIRDFIDGTSNTLGFSEVKAYTNYIRDGDDISGFNAPIPTDLSGFTNGTYKDGTGHTEWTDGRVHQTGFTTAFGPNKETLISDGTNSGVGDFTNCREAKSCAEPTYAAITSRSHHEGLVHTLMMDGSVRPTNDSIDLGTWQLLSTRNDGQVVGEY